MAAVGSVWARPPTALRILGELVAVSAELPRWGFNLALGFAARLGAALVGRRMLRRSYLGPLIERSGVLSGATVTLHGVRPAPQLGLKHGKYGLLPACLALGFDSSQSACVFICADFDQHIEFFESHFVK